MRVVVVDLEGTGSVGGETEAIVQIAFVPLTHTLKPQAGAAFATYVNPGRPITPRPWLPHQITDATVAGAPALADITSRIRELVDGAVLIGHGVRSDWRLLSASIPGLAPVGFADTLVLAERLTGKGGNTLTERVVAAGLGPAVDASTPGAAPHDARWDAFACALLLGHYANELGLATPEAVVHAAAVKHKTVPTAAPTLFD